MSEAKHTKIAINGMYLSEEQAAALYIAIDAALLRQQAPSAHQAKSELDAFERACPGSNRRGETYRQQLWAVEDLIFRRRA